MTRENDPGPIGTEPAISGGWPLPSLDGESPYLSRADHDHWFGVVAFLLSCASAGAVIALLVVR